MKREEPTKTFMVILNWKNPLVSWFFFHFIALKVNDVGLEKTLLLFPAL